MNLTAVSLFSGLGGLDLGFERAGFNVMWANDSTEEAVKSYALNFELEPVCASINDIGMEEIPESDVIIGGPPCQSFSMVGQRNPEDERGALVFRFLEIVKSRKPRAFVMENVPGIVSSRVNGVRLTDALAAEFEGAGYDVVVCSLVATEFGVPQLRRRVFMIGGRGFRPRIPSGSDFLSEEFGVSHLGRTATDALGDLGPCVAKGELADYRTDRQMSEYALLMRRGGGAKVSLHECPRMSITDRSLVEHIPPGGNYRDVPDEVATPRIMRIKKTGGRTTTYGRLHPDRPAHTINTYFRRPNVGMHFHYVEQRLITPREAMRLQSFPDRFEISATSQDRRNALIGNAVPMLMAQGVAWSLAVSWGRDAPGQLKLGY